MDDDEHGGCSPHRAELFDEDRLRPHVRLDAVRAQRRGSTVDRHAEVAHQQPSIQPHEFRSMTIRMPVCVGGHRVSEFVQQPPGRLQKSGNRIESRVASAKVERARRGRRSTFGGKRRPIFNPDGIHHTLRLGERDRAWITQCNEALLPCIDLAAPPRSRRRCSWASRRPVSSVPRSRRTERSP